jgi:ubiquinone/menaquinone biosynthesis C-methylase UbiE
MRKEASTSLLVSLAVLALHAAWWVYSRRPRARVPSQEGLDDPEVIRGFNRVAIMPHMRLLRWFVARRAVRMAHTGEAVDLGCGPGHLAVKLAQLATGLRVTGLDLSDEMLAQAEGRARQAGLGDRVSFRQGDVAQIPFPDGSLDLVVSTLSLHHWRDPVAVLDEIARVLRPGGAYLIFDLRRDLAAPFYLSLWFATTYVVPLALQRVNEPLSSRDASYTPQEAAHLVEQSGLAASAALTTGGWRIAAGPLWLIVEGIKGE